MAHAVQAQDFKVLYKFTDSNIGWGPVAQMLVHSGSLYGVTAGGGTSGWGTVFQVDIGTGQETVLHDFAGQPSDGLDPWAALIRDPAGNLYGATNNGGPTGPPYGNGIVFKVDSFGTETVLHYFTGSDGANPYGIVRDTAGNLYGAAAGGGDPDGQGTVFKLDAAGNLTTLHYFTDSPDGATPEFLLLEKDSLYGTTVNGGAGGGTVFKLNPGSGEMALLYSFTGGADGDAPCAFTSDGAGNLYGVTLYGGNQFAGSGAGVVFMVNVATGHETVLHTFTGPDGANPYAGLVRDAQGNLYGTTRAGGLYNQGTVFQLNPSGALTVLHHFTGGIDGSYPNGGVVLGPNGNLYGAAMGGKHGFGTIYGIVIPRE